MQTQQERLTSIMDGVLGKIKLTDKCKGEASGPQLVMAVDPAGNQGLTVGWQLTVWIQHDKLIGQDPVGVSVPVGVLLPPQEVVEQITRQLLEEARKRRFEMSSKISQESIASMGEAMRQIGKG
jgi:hypothetical protein